MISTLKTPLNVEIKMKKLLTLISILLIISCGDKIREEITERYDDGSKKLVVKYQGKGSNEIVVERIYYGESGDTSRWENYKSDGVKDGFWVTKDSSGVFKVGKKDGEWTWYWNNGQIDKEGNYRSGFKSGKWTKYWNNGQIWEEGNYKDDKRDGKWILYYEDGQILLETNYKDGELIETKKD